MRRKKKSKGLAIHSEEKKIVQHSWKAAILDYVTECLCMIVLLYGSIYGLFASCGVISYRKGALFVTVLIAFLTFGALGYKKNRIFLVIYLLVSAAILFVGTEPVIDGAKYVAVSYVKLVNHYFNLNIELSTELENEMYSARTCITSFQVFLVWLTALLTGICRKIYKKSLLALISPILIFALIFIVGLLPESQYIFAFLIGFLPLSLSCKGEDTVIGIQAKLTTLASAGVLVLICICIFPRAKYKENIESIITIKEDFQNKKGSEIMENVGYYLSDLGGGDNKFFSTGYKGLSSGTLGERDSIHFDKKTDFVLTTALNDIKSDYYEVYLRGFVGSNYEGREWKALDKEQQKSYDLLAAKHDFNFENLLTESLEVNSALCFSEEKNYDVEYQIDKKRIGRKHMLLPYGLIGDVKSKNGLLYTDKSYKHKVYSEKGTKLALIPFSTYFTDESYAERQPISAVTNMMMEYNRVFGSDSDLVSQGHVSEEDKRLKEFADKEVDYRRFVYDTYTKVPDDIAPTLRAILKETAKENDGLFTGRMNYEEKFADYFNSSEIGYMQWQCRKFLFGSADYSLSPGKTPEDKDFIDYFLFDNKKGYCTYYATAATVYLRLLGLPARYVEGYKIDSRYIRRKVNETKMNGKVAYRVEVPDEKAHAWVEVYVNGCGWVPFDFTPGVGSDGLQSDWKEQQANIPVPSPSVSPKATSQTNGKNPLQSAVPSNDASKKNGGIGKTNKYLGRMVQKTLEVMLVLVLIGAVFGIRLLVIHKKKKRKMESLLNNIKAKFYYHQVEDMSRAYYRGRRKEEKDWILELCNDFNDVTMEESQRFISIVERATFGAGQVSDYECARCVILYHKVKEELYSNASIVKKLYYYVWKAF